MHRSIVALVAGACLVPLAVARTKADDTKDTDRLQNSGAVMSQVLNIPDDIPRDVLNKARCVIVLPGVLKAALVAGGSYGRGVMTCRTGSNFSGPWGAPAMYALEGGSVGLQIGGEATDFVILVMNEKGVESLLKSKVQLGGDASIAAGPKGRTASADTDAYMKAELLSYSRSRGVFAGVSLQGTTLRPDEDANHKVYGNNMTAQEIIKEPASKAPAAAHELTESLEKASPHLNP